MAEKKSPASKKAGKKSQVSKKTVKKSPASKKIKAKSPALEKAVEKSPALEKAGKIAKIAAATADEGKAENILILEMTNLTTLCNYFVICTGRSAPHLKALSERIVECVRNEINQRPGSVSGDTSSRWLVLDYGSVIVHILSPETREYYQLEHLWGDAPRVAELLPEIREKRNVQAVNKTA